MENNINVHIGFVVPAVQPAFARWTEISATLLCSCKVMESFHFSALHLANSKTGTWDPCTYKLIYLTFQFLWSVFSEETRIGSLFEKMSHGKYPFINAKSRWPL